MSKRIPDAALPGVGVANSASGLADIAQPEKAAVLWHREVPATVQAWLDTLRPDLLPEVRVILPPNVLRDGVQAVFETCGTPDCDESRWLIDDFSTLGATFTDIMQARYLRLRLNVVTGNSCRRFHIDAVRARLICTYRGSGTQYAFTQGGASPEAIHSVPTGCPVILRGTEWPETPTAGLLHRSPPIEGSGEARLLLVFDPIDDPEDEA